MPRKAVVVGEAGSILNRGQNLDRKMKITKGALNY